MPAQHDARPPAGKAWPCPASPRRPCLVLWLAWRSPRRRTSPACRWVHGPPLSRMALPTGCLAAHHLAGGAMCPAPHAFASPLLSAVQFPSSPQLAQLWSSGSSQLAGSRLLWALRRLGVGFAVVAAMKEGSKPVFLAVLPLLYRFFPLPIRRLWQPPVHNLAAPPPAAAGQQQRRPNGRQSADGDSTHDEAPLGQQGSERQSGGVRTRRAAAAAAAVEHTQGGGKQAAASAAPASGPSEALPPQDPRLAELPHDAQGRPWDVVVTARFFSYAAIGVAVAGVSPRLLDALGW